MAKDNKDTNTEIEYVVYNDPTLISTTPLKVFQDLPWITQSPLQYKQSVANFSLDYNIRYFTQIISDSTYTLIEFQSNDTNYPEIIFSNNYFKTTRAWIYEISFSISKIPWSSTKVCEALIGIDSTDVYHLEQSFANTSGQTISWSYLANLNIWQVIWLYYKQISWASETVNGYLSIKSIG